LLTGTALPGEIGKVWGVPVIATLLLLETYTTDEASAVSGTYSNALILNRNAGIIGDRRIFTIKSSDELLIQTDQLLMVASERLAFKAQYTDAIVKVSNIGA